MAYGIYLWYQTKIQPCAKLEQSLYLWYINLYLYTFYGSLWVVINQLMTGMDDTGWWLGFPAHGLWQYPAHWLVYSNPQTSTNRGLAALIWSFQRFCPVGVPQPEYKLSITYFPHIFQVSKIFSGIFVVEDHPANHQLDLPWSMFQEFQWLIQYTNGYCKTSQLKFVGWSSKFCIFVAGVLLRSLWGSRNYRGEHEKIVWSSRVYWGYCLS